MRYNRLGGVSPAVEAKTKVNFVGGNIVPPQEIQPVFDLRQVRVGEDMRPDPVRLVVPTSMTIAHKRQP